MTARASKRSRTSLDAQLLQTAASLENLAVTAYENVARLLASRGGPAAVGTFAASCRSEHAAHAAAFNAAAIRAGGAVQRAPDPRLEATVHDHLTHITPGPSAVILLESLEDINAQSYTRYASLASSAAVRSLFVSVAIDEAAHRAFLIAAQQLMTTGPAELLAFPTKPAELPAAVGSECCPRAFYPTSDASAIDQGAVR